MTQAVRCGRCGVRYDGRHAKCPRCGGRVPLPLETAPAARRKPGGENHRVAIAASMCLAAVMVAAGGLWLTTGTGAAPTAELTRPAPGTNSGLFRHDDYGSLKPAARVPTDIPFVESPAAGRRDYAQGNYEDALAQFLAQISAEPGNAEPHSNGGQVLVRLGRTSEALPLLQKAVDLDPGRWAYRFNLARAEGLMGQWDKAAAHYAEAASLFPNDYATLFNLGQALHRAGREEEAVAQYRQAIQLKPEDPTFYLALAASEDKLGRAAEAAAAYRQYVSMEPSSRHAAAITARAKRLEAASSGEQVRQ